MNEWELTDEEIFKATLESWESMDVIYRAIATAAQKKLVEWLIVEFDTPTLTQEFVDKWARLKAALGVKE